MGLESERGHRVARRAKARSAAITQEQHSKAIGCIREAEHPGCEASTERTVRHPAESSSRGEARRARARSASNQDTDTQKKDKASGA